MLLLPQQPITSLQGKSNEWYTPSKYIEAARKVMGGIDLDPASCELANRTVKAKKYFTERDNGLAQKWYGNVFLNPPYSSSKSVPGLGGAKRKGPTHLFVAKLFEEFRNGNVTQAIVCINSDMNRIWFQCFWDYILCFPLHPIHFYKPNLDGTLEKDSQHSHFFGSCFVYLGTNEQTFIREFSKFGHIAKSIAGPRHETAQARLWGVV